MERPINPQAEEKLRIMDIRGIPLVVCGSMRSLWGIAAAHGWHLTRLENRGFRGSFRQRR
jgi:hypothetical protein